MTGTFRFVCCVALLALSALPLCAQQIRAQESKPVSVTATIEAIDQANRTVELLVTDDRPEAERLAADRPGQPHGHAQED